MNTCSGQSGTAPAHLRIYYTEGETPSDGAHGRQPKVVVLPDGAARRRGADVVGIVGEEQRELAADGGGVVRGLAAHAHELHLARDAVDAQIWLRAAVDPAEQRLARRAERRLAAGRLRRLVLRSPG